MAMNRVDTLGENAMVARLRRLLPPGGAGVVTGIGDDCAVVRPSAGGDRDWLLTSDPVIEGRHFLSDTPPERIGHKAVGRVLSDLAAMGGDPLWGLVDLVVPTDTPMERVEGVYRSLAALAGRWGLGIVGGDVAAGPVLELHVFGVGSVPRGAAILRSGAREGDVVCVTGALGGSRAGRQYTFTPRLDEGRFLREGGWATAMIDVTDGLAADLPRLAAASGVSAEIRLEDLPLHPDTRLTDRSPVRQALEDGEDFELLFTVPADRLAELRRAWPAERLCGWTPIGSIGAGSGEVWSRSADGARSPIRSGGFDHFFGSGESHAHAPHE